MNRPVTDTTAVAKETAAIAQDTAQAVATALPKVGLAKTLRKAKPLVRDVKRSTQITSKRLKIKAGKKKGLEGKR